MQGKRIVLSLLVLLSAAQAGGAPNPAPPAFKPPSPVSINKAIDKGVAWLEKAQHADGSWGPCTGSWSYTGKPTAPEKCYFTGPTSFSVFVLARCGVKESDEHIQKALKWLREYPAKGTAAHPGYTSGMSCYELASIALMLTELNRNDRKAELRRKRRRSNDGRPLYFSKEDWEWLGKTLRRFTEFYQRRKGGFGYMPHNPPYQDVSNTQFAALALRQAVLAGYRLKDGREVWNHLAEYLHGQQRKDGGFGYHEKVAEAAGMTAAGLSCLLICREQLGLLHASCPSWLDDSIRRASDRLGQVFDAAVNRCDDSLWSDYHYCYLYAVERCGAISGRTLYGGRDWYLRGASYLLDNQAGDGSWTDSRCLEPQDVLGTCFALLFLKRATMPAVTIAPEK